MEVTGVISPPEERMDLITIGDSQLERECEPVHKFDRRLWNLLDRMTKTMYHNRGAGLAAVQVGVPEQVIVADYGEGPVELINPEILREKGEETAFEGCLSVPGYLGEVTRPTELRLRAADRDGETFWLDLHGWPARVLRHEIDHLRGTLFVDRSDRVIRLAPEAQLRVVFMGSPEFSTYTLRALLDNNCTVVGVVTAPDRPRGRGQKLQPTPVKRLTQCARIPVLQPGKSDDHELARQLRWLEPDVIITCAYGRLLKPEILEIPRQGCINAHPSLLPLYRGAAPIERQLLAGEKETGVTVFYIQPEMDAGPILAQRATPISGQEDAGALHDRLAVLSGRLVLESLEKIARDEARPREQDSSRATFAPKIRREELQIDWTEPAGSIVNRIRAFSPRPGAWTMHRDYKLKVLRAEASAETDGSAQPGEVLDVGREFIRVACSSGSCLLRAVQPAGSRPMDIDDFINGHEIAQGDMLGEGGASADE